MPVAPVQKHFGKPVDLKGNKVTLNHCIFNFKYLERELRNQERHNLFLS